jgi:hypothetical protein
MSALEADIARIAALRGRKASDYAPENQPRRHLHVLQLEALLRMEPSGQRADLLALDQVPTASRMLIVTWERQINAVVWLDLLIEHEDEAFLIRTFRAWYAERFGHEGDGPRRLPHRRRRFS